MGKKILYILIIISLIISGIYAAKHMSEEKKVTQTGTNIIESANKNNKENEKEENKTIEPEVNEIENNNVEAGTTELAPEEEAKQIVEENWGEDDTVYYSYDGKDEKGRYVICVREKATTKALYRYYVDIETGSFDIE